MYLNPLITFLRKDCKDLLQGVLEPHSNNTLASVYGKQEEDPN